MAAELNTDSVTREVPIQMGNPAPPNTPQPTKVKQLALQVLAEIDQEISKELSCWIWQLLCNVCAAIVSCVKGIFCCEEQQPNASLDVSVEATKLNQLLCTLKNSKLALEQKIKKFQLTSSPQKNLLLWNNLGCEIEQLKNAYKTALEECQIFIDSWKKKAGKQFRKCKKLIVQDKSYNADFQQLKKQYKEFNKKTLPQLLENHAKLTAQPVEAMSQMLVDKLSTEQAFEIFNDYQNQVCQQLVNASNDTTSDRTAAFDAYVAYEKLYDTFKGWLLGTHISAVFKHADIRQLYSKLLGTSNKTGLPNFNSCQYTIDEGNKLCELANTCWMNTGIQMLRLIPGIMDKLRAPIQKQIETEEAFKKRKELAAENLHQSTTESPEEFNLRKQEFVNKLTKMDETDIQFANRVNLRDAFLKVIDGMSRGPKYVQKSLKEFWDELYYTKDLFFSVPPEFQSNPAGQKDSAEFVDLMLRISGIELRLTSQNSVNNVATAPSPVSMGVLPIPIVTEGGQTLSFMELLERSCVQTSPVHGGTKREEWRLAEVPRSFLTSLKRFVDTTHSIDEGSPKIDPEIYETIHNLFMEFLRNKYNFDWEQPKAQAAIDTFCNSMASICEPELTQAGKQKFQKEVSQEVMKWKGLVPPKIEKFEQPLEQFITAVYGAPNSSNIHPLVFHAQKINSPVHFPKPNASGEVVIDLTNSVLFRDLKAAHPGKSFKYRLVSIDSHVNANSAYAGHYIARGRCADGLFREFDDAEVSDVSALKAAHSYVQGWELITDEEDKQMQIAESTASKIAEKKAKKKSKKKIEA